MSKSSKPVKKTKLPAAGRASAKLEKASHAKPAPKAVAKPVSRPAAKPVAKVAAVKAATKPSSKPEPPPKAQPRPVAAPSNGAAEMRQQSNTFAKAMEQFHAREFRKAKHLFEGALNGPSREMAYAARQHILMCEQRMTKTTVDLTTPEDHYNYAITLINQRDLASAQQHLQEALRAEDADHFHYALALCLGLGGDLQGASTHLQRAIEMQPRNRVAARNDPDFMEIAKHRPLREILFPERKTSP